MPTVGQFLSTQHPVTPDRHYITLTAGPSAGGVVDVTLPDGTVSTALVPVGLTIASGRSVLLLLAACGNVVICALT